MNTPILSLRTNVQNLFDNAVRSLSESLRSFILSSNRASYVMIGSERTVLQECLVGTRDAVEEIIQFLLRNASSSIFDCTISTETRMETDLKAQTDELKTAIEAATDLKCLSAIGLTTHNIGLKYQKYSNSVRTCITALQHSSNTAILQKCGPEYTTAFDMLNLAGITLLNAKTRAQVVAFVGFVIFF